MKTPPLYSPAQVRPLVGCSRTTLNDLASKHGIGRMIGRCRLYTQADVKKLKQLFNVTPGRPPEKRTRS